MPIVNFSGYGPSAYIGAKERPNGYGSRADLDSYVDPDARIQSGINLLELSLFAQLQSNEQQRLWDYLQVREFNPDDVIIREGHHNSGIFVIVTGSVRIVRGCSSAATATRHKGSKRSPVDFKAFLKGAETSVMEQWKETPVYPASPSSPSHCLTLAICGPGEVLGELEACDQAGHSATVLALSNCRMLWVSSSDFAGMQVEIPQITRNLVGILTLRLRQLTVKSQALARLNLSHRIAFEILHLATRFGTHAQNGSVSLPFCLRQDDLADLVGSSRECVNRALRPLRHYLNFTVEGAISLSDIEGLQNFYQSGLN